MRCSSHSGWLIAPSSNSIPLLIWLSILPMFFVVIWVLMETLPFEKKHGLCLQIDRKEKFKGRNRMIPKTVQGGSFFFFLIRVLAQVCLSFYTWCLVL